MSRKYVAPIDGVSPEQMDQVVTSFLAFAKNQGHDLRYADPFSNDFTVMACSDGDRLITEWLDFLSATYPAEIHWVSAKDLLNRVLDLDAKVESGWDVFKAISPETIVSYLTRIGWEKTDWKTQHPSLVTWALQPTTYAETHDTVNVPMERLADYPSSVHTAIEHIAGVLEKSEIYVLCELWREEARLKGESISGLSTENSNPNR